MKKTLSHQKSRRLYIAEETEDRPSITKEVKIMKFGLWLQIEKLEAKLKRYRRDNEELRDTNTNSEVIIKIHEMQKELKEQKIYDQKKSYRKIAYPNWEIKRRKWF